MRDGLTIEEFVGREGLRAVRPIWERLMVGLAQPRFCQTYDWHASYLESLEAEPEAVRIFSVRRGETPLAVFPLRLSHERMLGVPLRVLRLPTHPALPLSDGVCVDGESGQAGLRALVHWLRRHRRQHWDALGLGAVLEDSCVMRSLATVQSLRLVVPEVMGSNYLSCPAAGDPLGQLSKNFRANLRKARNKLAELSDVEYVEVHQGPGLRQAFTQFLEVEASGWKGQDGTGTAIRVQPDVLRFYENLLDRFGPLGGCRIHLLRADGRCLAGQFCLVVADTLYVLKIGYDEAYARCAPGNMLLERVLQTCSRPESGIHVVSLVTAREWHQNWRPRCWPVSQAWVFNTTMAGLTAYGLLRPALHLAPLYRRHLRPIVATTAAAVARLRPGSQGQLGTLKWGKTT